MKDHHVSIQGNTRAVANTLIVMLHGWVHGGIPHPTTINSLTHVLALADKLRTKSAVTYRISVMQLISATHTAGVQFKSR